MSATRIAETATEKIEAAQTAIAKAVQVGVPLPFAAKANGVGESTAAHWMAMGLVDPEAVADEATRALIVRCHEFRRVIEEAQGKAVAHNVAVVRQAANAGTWQAAAWWLERRYPETFGRSTKVVIQSEESLERELVELLGQEQAAALIAGAREKINAMRTDHAGRETLEVTDEHAAAVIPVIEHGELPAGPMKPKVAALQAKAIVAGLDPSKVAGMWSGQAEDKARRKEAKLEAARRLAEKAAARERGE